MRAYRGTTMTKAETLAQLAAHRKADEIIQGAYWGDGHGCAVGCLTHDSDGGHDRFPELFGVPTQIAYLMDAIFESLPAEKAKDWPTRIMGAIPEGADLSRAWDRWCAWMLADLATLDSEAQAEVQAMADLFARAAAGDEPAAEEWDRAAEAARAVWDARDAGAAWAVWAAGDAWAAGAARDAGAVWAAGAAGAARDAWAVWAAGDAWAAWAVWAAGDAWAADELVRIMETSPVEATA